MRASGSLLELSGWGAQPSEGRSLTAADIAALTGGRLEGSAQALAHRVAPVDRAGPGDLTFVSGPRYAAFFEASRASVVLVSPELAQRQASGVEARVIVDRPHDAMMGLLARFYRAPARVPGVAPTASIGRGAAIGSGVAIGPGVIVGAGATLGDRCQVDAYSVIGEGASIGEDSHLYSHVTIYAGATLGSRVIVHSGARLGCDGFGYVFKDGAHLKIPHVGRCIIGDDVEIGANSCVDRGSVDDTVIGAGSKLDNLVHVGHNVRIGRLCLLMAQVGIAGSSHVGDGVILAGQVGLAGHLAIGDGARIGAQGGVVGDVPAGATWSGMPARPHKDVMRAQAALFKLTGLIRQLERLVGEKPES